VKGSKAINGRDVTIFGLHSEDGSWTSLIDRGAGDFVTFHLYCSFGQSKILTSTDGLTFAIKRAAGRSRYSIPSHHALYDRRKRQISFRFRAPPSGMLLV
jgi:hypothetical protein